MLVKREIEGRWWPVGHSGEARYGVLHFDPETGLNLEIKEARPQKRPRTFPSDSDHSKTLTILGRDESNKPITLFFCFQRGSRSRAGFRNLRYRVGYAFMGHQFYSWEDAKFSTSRLNLTGLQEWLACDSFQMTQEGRTHHVTYAMPEETVYAINAGLEIRIRTEATFRHGMRGENSLTLSEKRLLELHWKKPLHFRDVKRHVLTIMRFFSLITGRATYVSEYFVFRRLPHGKRTSRPTTHPIEILTENAGAVAAQGRSMFELLSFKDVRQNFPEILSRWMEYANRFEEVVTLYSSVIFNHHLYQNHQFLFLAQALEKYHSIQFGGTREPRDQFKTRLRTAETAMGPDNAEFFRDRLCWANEKSFAQRLEEILKHRASIANDVLKAFPDFPQLVRNTRNYYTHFDERLLRNKKTAEGAQFANLVQVMRLLLENLFLHDLGLPIFSIRHRMPNYILTRE